MSSRLDDHHDPEGTHIGGADTSQQLSALQASDVIRKMRAYANARRYTGGNANENENDETLTCEEIARMLEYAEKKSGDPSGEKMSKLRIAALAISGDISDDNFERLGVVEYIDSAIRFKRKVVSLAHDGDPNKPSQLNSLADSYLLRFDRLGDVPDISEAIACLTQALEFTPENHSFKPLLFKRLGTLCMHRFDHLGDISDVDKAIMCGTQAMELTPDGDANKPSLFNNLGNSYDVRFRRLGDRSDIDQAITCQARAVELTPDNHVDKPGRLGNLGRLYSGRFRLLGKLSDVEKAIACQTQAVTLTPDGDGDKPAHLSNLGNSYQARFEQLGELQDIDKAITCQAQAVDLTPEGHASRPGHFNNLGNSYQARFEQFGELSDINNAIGCQEKAAEAIPEGHSDKPAYFSNLGIAFMRRFQRLGELLDADQAITYQTRAVELVHEAHANKPTLLGNLGSSYWARSTRSGKLSDIDNAIACQTPAVEMTPDDHAAKPTWLNNLGTSHQARFERLGELSDIDKAIAFLSLAVELTYSDHAGKPARLSNLGNSYQARFERLGERSDIDKAILYQTQAVEATPSGHADKSAWLNNLGGSYMRRFDSFEETSDAEKAIIYYNQALEIAPNDHSDKPGWLSNLGVSYRRRFERLGVLSDIIMAVACQTQAVELTPEDHADRPGQLDNLGCSYDARFKRLGEMLDINKAISCKIGAVEATPDGHADKPAWLNSLGSSYLSRFERFSEQSDGESASSSFQMAAQLPISKPTIQFHSARQWARCSSSLGVSPRLGYKRALELVPRLVWLGLTIERRYDVLIEIGDLATEAAAWAISVKDYSLALEWLEEGRSIVWNQILHLRRPFDDLFTVNPVLAERLEGIARELEHASSRPMPRPLDAADSSDREQVAQRHRQLAGEWEQLLTKARAIDGFQNFMLPRKASELRLAAKDGPVVLINVHSLRCDALILQQNHDNIAHVPLPDFSREKAAGICENLTSLLGLPGTRSRGLRLKPATHQAELRRILAALWSDVAKPVLDFLGFTRNIPADELPHIVWCTTGPLTFLPLHAAGCYNGWEPNAPDLVVSSFVPTLGALLSAPTQPLGSHSGILAVGQQFSKEHGDLPCTVAELEAINTHSNAECFKKLEGLEATVEAVLDAMDKHSWVHLACHASQHPKNPAHSAFHLHDGDLSLEAITKRSFKNKGLAFLSACQTAAGDEKRPDESIHLAAGMLMAGYPSVIATMWSIYDVDGPEVADLVYVELLKDGNMDCKGAARALHKAVAGLREQIGGNAFMRWVPFIHIGA